MCQPPWSFLKMCVCRSATWLVSKARVLKSHSMPWMADALILLRAHWVVQKIVWVWLAIICWNARKWGIKSEKYYGDNLECVNPITWKRDNNTAPASLNTGSVPYGFNRIDKAYADATISPTGLLWVNKKPKKGYVNGNSYHVLDYNLYWMNIRENVKLRTETYLQKNSH